MRPRKVGHEPGRRTAEGCASLVLGHGAGDCVMIVEQMIANKVPRTR